MYWDELEEDLAKKEAAGESNSEEEKEKDLPPPPAPYLKRARFLGMGPHRVGQPFTFREDMYSLMFIANVRKEYKD